MKLIEQLRNCAYNTSFSWNQVQELLLLAASAIESWEKKETKMTREEAINKLKTAYIEHGQVPYLDNINLNIKFSNMPLNLLLLIKY